MQGQGLAHVRSRFVLPEGPPRGLWQPFSATAIRLSHAAWQAGDWEGRGRAAERVRDNENRSERSHRADQRTSSLGGTAGDRRRRVRGGAHLHGQRFRIPAGFDDWASATMDGARWGKGGDGVFEKNGRRLMTLAERHSHAPPKSEGQWKDGSIAKESAPFLAGCGTRLSVPHRGSAQDHARRRDAPFVDCRAQDESELRSGHAGTETRSLTCISTRTWPLPSILDPFLQLFSSYE